MEAPDLCLMVPQLCELLITVKILGLAGSTPPDMSQRPLAQLATARFLHQAVEISDQRREAFLLGELKHELIHFAGLDCQQTLCGTATVRHINVTHDNNPQT